VLVLVRCDDEPDCKKDDLYKRFLPPEQQPWGCEQHAECELHVVWVRCVNDGGMHHSFLKGHMCPEYYYAHKYVAPPPSPPAPGAPPAPPAPPSPPSPKTWLPTPWVSAEKIQHVENQDRYLTGAHMGPPQGAHVYYNGEALEAPRGKWALTLPSDDNKLRRKWYRSRSVPYAGDLDLPEGRGELVAGGQSTTLRWRPKYRYAHGYKGQDGPHWLGGYSDIRDPPKYGADSNSGRGLAGVNVYNWGVDKQVQPNVDNIRAVGHAQFSLWHDVKQIGSSLSELIWPDSRAEQPSHLHSTHIYGLRGSKAVPNPLGEIM
jgi:hypothetical protein